MISRLISSAWLASPKKLSKLSTQYLRGSREYALASTGRLCQRCFPNISPTRFWASVMPSEYSTNISPLDRYTAILLACQHVNGVIIFDILFNQIGGERGIHISQSGVGRRIYGSAQ